VYGPEDGPHANTQYSGRDPRDADVPHKVTARDPAPRISNPHDARPSINLAKAKFYSVWGPEVNRFLRRERQEGRHALCSIPPRNGGAARSRGV